MAAPRLERRDDESLEEFQQRRKQTYLSMANAARSRLKILRRALRLGAIDDLELLRGNMPEYEPLINTWTIERLLRACRNIGPSRSNAILEAARVSPNVKVGELSFAKRQEIARMVDDVRQAWGKV
jgi:hypothetical protein